MIKVKVIPNRIFHKLLDESKSFSSQHEFVKAVLIDKSISFKYDSYELDYVEAGDVLREVWRIQNDYDIKSVIKDTKKSISVLSHKYFIPTRTIEDWVSKRRIPPFYVKFMIIKDFKLYDLGKHIYIESDKPKEQKKKKPVGTKTQKTDLPIINTDDSRYTRSIKHKTYIEIQRELEESKRKRDIANDRLSRYLRKKKESQRFDSNDSEY